MINYWLQLINLILCVLVFCHLYGKNADLKKVRMAVSVIGIFSTAIFIRVGAEDWMVAVILFIPFLVLKNEIWVWFKKVFEKLKPPRNVTNRNH